MNPVLEAIYKRRSIRHFTREPVPRETILEIIRAGSWAPSGLNNQPWRFAIVTEPELKTKFEGLTRYCGIIAQSQALIPVFVDREAMYNPTKDYQSMGACLQNMLLAAHSMEIGAVWLGEILKNGDKVRELLNLPGTLELMAVIAMGHPAKRDQTSERKSIEEVIVFDG
jgi:nitroreductase